MYDINEFKLNLFIYIVVVVLLVLVIATIVNAVFLILHLTKIFREKKVWIITNIVGFLILLTLITPAILDASQESYCKIDNVIDIEVDVKANNSSKYILITDKDGKVYTCYDFLIDTENFDNVTYPGVAVYAKHSKLLLGYYAY
jgi:hypothetical protein